MLFGSSFFFLFLIHNFIYSNEFVFLVERGNIDNSQKIKISDYLLLFKSIFSENFQIDLLKKIYLDRFLFFLEFFPVLGVTLWLGLARFSTRSFSYFQLESPNNFSNSSSLIA